MSSRIALELRRGARIVAFGALTGAMVPGFVAHEALTPKDGRDGVRERWVRLWCSAQLDIFGVHVIAD